MHKTVIALSSGVIMLACATAITDNAYKLDFDVTANGPLADHSPDHILVRLMSQEYGPMNYQ